MKKTPASTSPASGATTAQPKLIGKPVRLHKEQYFELKSLIHDARLAEQSATQTLHLARTVAANAQRRVDDLMKKLNLDLTARWAADDDTHSLQRME